MILAGYIIDRWTLKKKNESFKYRREDKWSTIGGFFYMIKSRHLQMVHEDGISVASTGGGNKL